MAGAPLEQGCPSSLPSGIALYRPGATRLRPVTLPVWMVPDPPNRRTSSFCASQMLFSPFVLRSVAIETVSVSTSETLADKLRLVGETCTFDGASDARRISVNALCLDLRVGHTSRRDFESIRVVPDSDLSC